MKNMSTYDLKDISAEYLRITAVWFFVNALPYIFTSIISKNKPIRIPLDTKLWSVFWILLGWILVYSIAYILSDYIKEGVKKEKIWFNIFVWTILLIVFLFLLAYNITHIW